MSPPPVSEFRLIQLPIKKRIKFGDWLNVSFDDNIAVNVIAASPCERIDCNKWKHFDIMTADAVKDIKLKGCTAALIVSETDKLLDAIEEFENDYNLPKGVKSRSSDYINASSYWVRQINPDNIDWHIEQAKKGGFRMMLLAHPSFFKYDKHGFYNCGDSEIHVANKRYIVSELDRATLINAIENAVLCD